MAQLTIQPPLAGIVRGRGFQKHPPFSSRDSINFWPQFVFDGTQTLGVRPPLDEYLAVATHPVNLLCRVNGTTAQTPQRTFLAAVNGQLQRWNGSALVNVGGSGTIPTGRAAFAQAFEQKVYIPAFTPLVYDYPTDTLSTWVATSGSVPSDARIIVHWLGSLWTAGQPNTPHIVSGCATGQPLNWNFNLDTPGAAFSTIGDNAGMISDPVCALVPASGDTMIVSGPDSMKAWRGHPRRGGVADDLSLSIGIRGQGAWAQGSDGTIFAITNKGLVAIQNAQVISLISDDRIPNSLIGLDYDYLDPRVVMAFDARFNGVHIVIRGDTADESEGWFYDLKHGGLHESVFSQYPYVMLPFDPIASGRASEVLFGGLGGLYRHDLDGTESYRARIVMGPMKLSNNATERSMIREAQVVLGGGTTALDAKVAFYCGPTGDSAYAAAQSGQAAAKYETTIDNVFAMEGRLRPMVAGHAATMVIDQEDAMVNPKIVFEESNLQLAPAGRERGFVQHSDTSGPRAGSFTAPPFNLLGSLVANYAMDDPTGTTRADSHTGGFTLTPASGSTPFDQVAGYVDEGCEFPNQLSAATNLKCALTTSNLNPETGMTVTFWYRTESGHPDGSGLNFVFFVEGVAMFFRRQDLTNDFELSLGGTAASIAENLFTSDDVFDGNWHFIAVRYDPEAATLSVRIDDETQTTAMGPVSWSFPSYNFGLHMGGGFFGGVVSHVDEFSIFNAAVPDEGIDRIYNSGSGNAYPFNN